MKQIPPYNRYSIWTNTYNGEDIEIMIGFEMESVKDNVALILFVQVYRNKNNGFAIKMQKHSESNGEKFDFYQIENDEVFVWYETSLLHFLSTNNQKERIVAWFSEKMKEKRK